MVVFVIILSVKLLQFVAGATDIALNQPSWQSGRFFAPPTGESSLSFDGKANPDFYNGSC